MTHLPTTTKGTVWLLIAALILIFIIGHLVQLNQSKSGTIHSYQDVIFDLSNTNQDLRGQVKELQKENDSLRKSSTQALLPDRPRILAEIKKVFGVHAQEAILVANCESGIAQDHTNHNTNGTFDSGVFQINSLHSKRFGDSFMADWRANIMVAKTLYDEQKWQPWYSSNGCHHLLASK